MGEETIEDYVGDLEDPVPLVRKYALRNLAATGRDDVVPHLIGCLEDDDAVVRLEAVCALRPFADRDEVVEGIRGRMEDAARFVRAAARNILRAAGFEVEDAPEAAPPDTLSPSRAGAAADTDELETPTPEQLDAAEEEAAETAEDADRSIPETRVHRAAPAEWAEQPVEEAPVRKTQVIQSPPFGGPGEEEEETDEESAPEEEEPTEEEVVGRREEEPEDRPKTVAIEVPFGKKGGSGEGEEPGAGEESGAGGEPGLEETRVVTPSGEEEPTEEPSEGSRPTDEAEAGPEAASDREELLREALADTDVEIAEEPGGYRILVPTTPGRRQFVHVAYETTEPENERVISGSTVCGPANERNYRWALEVNLLLGHAALGIAEQGGRDVFVLVATLLEAETSARELRKALLTLAFKGDWIEEAITGEDRL